MAKAGLDQLLADLRRLKGTAPNEQSVALLDKALKNKTNLIVAKAAEMTGEINAKAAIPQLEQAFVRLLDHPTQSDKGCLGKTALAKALHTLEATSESVFVMGARFVQLEAGWGESVDAAAELRGVCAMGLAQMGYRDALLILAELLADPQAPVRVAAARAIAATGREEGAMLLRLKALSGDREPDVVAECLQSLGLLSPGKSVEFLGRFLDSPEPTLAISAALALGETRRSDALDKLRDAWPRWSRSPDRALLLQAIALVRSPAAVEFLLHTITTEPENVAAEAIEAMRLYRNDSAVRMQLQAIIAQLHRPLCTRVFQKTFL